MLWAPTVHEHLSLGDWTFHVENHNNWHPRIIVKVTGLKREGPAIKNICCSCRGLKFNFQPPCGTLQPSVIPVPEGSGALFGLSVTVCTLYTDKHAGKKPDHTHKGSMKAVKQKSQHRKVGLCFFLLLDRS